MSDEEAPNEKDAPEYDMDREQSLLDLMIMAYHNEDKRFELIDNKSSTLIAFISAMFTFQATTGTYIIAIFLNNAEWTCIEYLIVLLFISSLICYSVAVFSFIKSYQVRKFQSVPSPEKLIVYGKENWSHGKIIVMTQGNMKNAIEHNKEVLQDKIKYMKHGFTFMKSSIILTFLFITLILIIKMSIV